MNPQYHAMLLEAFQSFQAGNLIKAEEMLRIFLRSIPDHSDALHLLAMVYASQSKHKEAIDCYKNVLKLNPNDASVLSNFGVSLSAISKVKEALSIFKKSLEINPNSPESWYNAGNTLCDLGEHEEALFYYEKSIKINPNYYQAHNNYGKAFFDLNRNIEALAYYDKALEINQSFPDCLINKGEVLRSLKRYDEAITQYDQALSLKPDYAEAWSNKGVTLHELKRYHEAISHYDQALSLKPDYAEAWSNKGVTLHELKRYHEAIAHYDQALSLKPDYAEAWSNKGVTLHELKRYDEAITHYDQALRIKPNINWIYGNLVHTKIQICSYSDLTDRIKYISKKVMENQKISQPFASLAFSDDAQLHKKSSEIYAQDRYPINSFLGDIPRSSKKEKIRIAYFSPDFRNHPISLLTSELFELHDRSKFEVFAFSLQGTSFKDEISLRLRSSFDRFIDVEDMPDLEIAQLSRELMVDIAIDLAGPTKYSRTGIFSYGVAPIQVNWLGYPGTVGADFMDYIVADKIVIPMAHRQFYTEKVAYLPNTYMVDDSRRIASSRVFTREECGLPENAFVYCCFNNDYKFNPQILDRWANILLSVENGILWISENNEYFKVNIKNEFEKRGIDPFRIIFAQRVELMADHLARYALADLFLDTHPYNAHTTAIDSLKSGVPVLTLKGQSFASRVAASLLHAIQLPELITTSEAEYELLAIELASNPRRLADLKKKLLFNHSICSLFDTQLFTKNLETLYAQMYQRYHAGLPPDCIIIN